MLLLRLKIDLGFDLGSIVREYHVYVPLECSFTREAEGMQVGGLLVGCLAYKGMYKGM